MAKFDVEMTTKANNTSVIHCHKVEDVNAGLAWIQTLNLKHGQIVDVNDIIELHIKRVD